MIKKFKDEFKTNYKLYLTLIALLIIFSIRLDYFIYSPGGLIELTDRTIVDSSYKQEGSFNMTYVTSRYGTIVNVLLSYIIPDWDLESVDDMRIENEDAKDIELRDKIYLKETSYNAVIAAFREANLPYSIDSVDVVVTYVFNDSHTNLKVNDIIKSINDDEVNDFDDIYPIIAKYKVGDRVNIKVLRNDKEVDCYADIIELNDRMAIGITLAEIKNVTTNPNVEFVFKKNESGSSRGLMCALDIYNKITEFDLTKGRVISGTGSIDENGIVGDIDGVKYKLKGAVKNGADVFIVPTNNYEEAIKLKKENNYDIEIIEADNLHNVIEKLK